MYTSFIIEKVSGELKMETPLAESMSLSYAT